MIRFAAPGTLLALLLLGAAGAHAQTDWDDEDRRSGFIIGFGIGPGVTFTGLDFGNPILGVSTDIRIGTEVGRTTQVYFLNLLNYFSEYPGSNVLSGMSGIGVSFVESRVLASLGFGLGLWTEVSDREIPPYCLDTSGDAQMDYICRLITDRTDTGVAASAGFGYEIADLWVVDISLAYANVGEDMLRLKVGINILSH